MLPRIGNISVNIYTIPLCYIFVNVFLVYFQHILKKSSFCVIIKVQKGGDYMNENIRIRQRRMDLGMSQEELAELVGYTGRSAIARIESGRNKVSISKIPTFAKALHTTEAYLLGVEEAPPTAEALAQYAYNSTSDTAKALRDHLLSAMKLLEHQPQVSEIADKYNRLTPANQKSVMDMINFLLQQQKAHPIKSDEVG